MKNNTRASKHGSSSSNDNYKVVLHLRSLRESCARSMAWCSALLWGEKAFIMSEDIGDLVWLVDALVTNGQYREAEEWFSTPRYSQAFRATEAGRHLASVVAMRLGRAEEALEILKTSISKPPTATQATAETPAITKLSNLKNSHAKISGPTYKSQSKNTDPEIHTDTASGFIPELNRRALALYMQGSAVIQLSNVGGGEDADGVLSLRRNYAPEYYVSSNVNSSVSFRSPEASVASGSKMPSSRPNVTFDPTDSMADLVRRLWTEAVRIEPRCWEVWSGMREYGILTCSEEQRLIDSVDWEASCGGDHNTARFFKSYCLATIPTVYSCGSITETTRYLVESFPRLSNDLCLLGIQAARLLSLGYSRDCLMYTSHVVKHRRIPDPNITAIHITALTTMNAKDALFRIAHELSEEFGISATRRLDIEPTDTNEYTISNITNRGMSTPTTNRAAQLGASSSIVSAVVSGMGRLQSGARGFLIPETPANASAGRSINGSTGGGGSLRRQSTISARYSASSRPKIETALEASESVWKGLWGLPTWTQPGPPVLSTYPCALGPTHGPSVSSTLPTSTLNMFTTTNIQSIGGPTQNEFIGASLAWYAIGCYYLVSTMCMVFPELAQDEWTLTSGIYSGMLADSALGVGGNNIGGIGIRGVNYSLSPEAEHALAESRRWLAKTTLASPRSITAWTSFAHTFMISGDLESAARALHTAVGLCGFGNAVYNKSSDLVNPALHPQETPSKQYHESLRDTRVDASAPELSLGSKRWSRLAYSPLASLGSVYLQMGDFVMAESCLDTSIHCLTGHGIDDWCSILTPKIGKISKDNILSWCKSGTVESSNGSQIQLPEDPLLLNEIGSLYYNRGKLTSACTFFATSLKALYVNTNSQENLHAIFAIFASRGESRSRKTTPDKRTLSALMEANMGNTLRRLGDFDAALFFLQKALTHSPLNADIMLSVAYTLHLRTIETFNNSETISYTDLDEAIRLYHSVLSVRQGDPLATDLLSLALELSSAADDTSFLDDILALDEVDASCSGPKPIGTLIAELKHKNQRVDEHMENAGSSSVNGSDFDNISEDSDDAMDLEDEEIEEDDNVNSSDMAVD